MKSDNCYQDYRYGINSTVPEQIIIENKLKTISDDNLREKSSPKAIYQNLLNLPSPKWYLNTANDSNVIFY